jgi:RHS repeat-associated protein
LGGEGNDTLNGDAGNDQLTGGIGNDILKGGEGSDKYFFNIGDGQDRIEETSGVYDRLVFGVDVNLKDIIINRVNDDLVFVVGSAGDQITVVKHHLSTGYQIEEFEIKGEVYTWEQLLAAKNAPNVASISVVTNAPLTTILVNFSRPMIASSFTAEDLDIRDENSITYPVTNIETVLPNQFRLNFAADLPARNYTLAIGPDIMGLSGLLIDQNGNGVSGEITDIFTQAFSVNYELPSLITPTVNALGDGSGPSIELFWSYTKPNDGVDIDQFGIYMSSTPFTNITNASLVKQIPANETTGLIENLVAGQNYYLAVVAIDIKGRYRQLVNSVVATPQQPVNETTVYTYNEQGQVLTENGPRVDVNDVVAYTYDAQSNLATATNGLGHTIHYNSYDANGNLLSVTDANGTTTEFTYHERGWLLTSTLKHPSISASDATTEYEYDAVGQLISTTLPNGVQLFYEYDDARRLKAISNAINERIEYTLDTEGNRTQQIIKNSSGNIVYSVSQVFDELSRVMQVLGNNGQVTDQDYDVNDNPVASTDGKNHRTENQYDALNRVQKIIDPKLGETQFTYNSQNQIKTVTDARGNTTRYQYNGLGQLLSLTSPDTGTTVFAYDAAGNRTSSTDARGVTINYTYDALNRLTHISYPNALESVQFVYDDVSNNNKGIGRLTSIIQTNQQQDYVYDYRGLIEKKIVTLNGITRVTEYQYDIAGNLTKIIYPSGREVNYQYNLLGQVDSITTVFNGISQSLMQSAQYLPFGPAKSFTYGNGLTHTQTYDQDYRLNAIQIGGIVDRFYGFDNANNITSIVNNVDLQKSQTFNYDELDRLITATGGYGNLLYTYDAVGNRLSETKNGATNNYFYESTSNRLTTISGNTPRNFVYDDAGNPIQRTSENGTEQTLVYNNANRLNSVSENSTILGAYGYNLLGQRTTKMMDGNVQEHYYYDEAGQLISVTDGAGNTQREYIYWGNQLIAFVANGNIYYAHTDHLNTPQVITNQSQQVVWAADYEPFGKINLLTNSIEIYSRFPGQYLDQETNLYYNYFRDYDPSIGRYIQSDPIGLGGGVNTYGYAFQNPNRYYDFFGLSAADIEIIMAQLKSEFHDLNPNGSWSFGKPEDGNIAETSRWNGDMLFPNKWNSPGCLSYDDFTDRMETIYHEMMHSTDSFWNRLTTTDEAPGNHHEAIRNRAQWEVGVRVWGAPPPTNVWGVPRLPDQRVNKKDLYEDYRNSNPDCECQK